MTGKKQEKSSTLGAIAGNMAADLKHGTYASRARDKANGGAE